MSDETIIPKREAAWKALRELDANFKKFLENDTGGGKSRLDVAREYTRERSAITEALIDLYDDGPPNQI